MLRFLRLQSTLVKPSTATTAKRTSPVLEATRIIPRHNTFYSPNAQHEHNLQIINSLIRRHIALPTVSHAQGKWLTLQQYQPLGGGERLKPSQHKQLVAQLNRLNSIDKQLVPDEVVNVLSQYSRSSSVTELVKKQATLDQFGRSRTIGGRKSSSAVVYLVKGTGEFLVNGKSINNVFPQLKHRLDLLYPFKVVEAETEYNVFAKVTGGGPTGQVGAIVNAIGKGLIIHNPLLKPRLYKAGCMTRDHRRVERKKPGRVKARKSPTWVKR
jgi:small subunit ribosomal protein S9